MKTILIHIMKHSLNNYLLKQRTLRRLSRYNDGINIYKKIQFIKEKMHFNTEKIKRYKLMLCLLGNCHTQHETKDPPCLIIFVLLLFSIIFFFIIYLCLRHMYFMLK